MPISLAAAIAEERTYLDRPKRGKFLRNLACGVQGYQGRAVCWQVDTIETFMKWKDEIDKAMEERTHVL